MRIGITFLVLFLIIGGVFAFALLNLNGIVNKNKDLILTQIEKSVERDVEVESIGINIWSGLGLKLSNFKIKDDPGFSEGNFIEARDLVVSLKLLPLLQKKVEVKKVILVEPEISVVKNSSGNYNFESLTGKNQKETTGEENKEGPIDNLLISLVHISNGKISYSDLERKSSIEVEQIDLASQNISYDKPIKFDLSFGIFSEKQNVNLAGEFGPIGRVPDFATTRLDVKADISDLNIAELERNFPELKKSIPQGLNPGENLDLRLSASGTGGELELKDIEANASVFSSEQQNLSLNGNAGPLGSKTDTEKLNLDLDFTLDSVQIENLAKFEPVKKSLPAELNANGPLSISGKINGNTNTLNLLFIRVDATNSNIQYANTFKKQKGDDLRLATDAVVTEMVTELKNTELTLNDLVVKADGKINTAENSAIDISLSTNRADLSSVSGNLTALKKYGLTGNFELDADLKGPVSEGRIPEINGTAKLTGVGANLEQLPKPVSDLNGEIVFTGNSARMDSGKLKLGSSEMIIDANAKTLDPLLVEYSLRSPEVRLSDISPSAVKDENIKNLNVKGTAREKNGDIQSNAVVSSDNGKFSKLSYKNLRGNISLENNVVNFKDIAFQFLNATLNASGNYNMQGEVPSFEVTTDLSGLNITDLIKTFINPDSETITGKTSLNLSISGKGSNWESISKTLDGLGQIELTEGKLVDFNLADEVLGGITGIQGLSGLLSSELKDKYPDVFKKSSTVFYNLKSPIRVENGKINMKNLILVASEYVVSGEGTIGLDSALDMGGTVVLSEKLTQDLVSSKKIIQVLKNEEGKLQIPFRLDGTLPGVNPQPDISFIARKIRTSVIEESKSRLKDKLVDEITGKSENRQKETENSEIKGDSRKPDENKSGESKPVEKLIEKGIKSIFE